MKIDDAVTGQGPGEVLIFQTVEDIVRRSPGIDGDRRLMGSHGDVGDIQKSRGGFIRLVVDENEMQGGVGMGQRLGKVIRLVAISPVALLGLVFAGIGPVGGIITEPDGDRPPFSLDQLRGQVITRVRPVG